MMHLAAKTVTFCENCPSNIKGFHEVMSEIPRFALFLVKKHTKNTMYLAKKTVTFCENCRSIMRGFD